MILQKAKNENTRTSYPLEPYFLIHRMRSLSCYLSFIRNSKCASLYHHASIHYHGYLISSSILPTTSALFLIMVCLFIRFYFFLSGFMSFFDGLLVAIIMYILMLKVFRIGFFPLNTFQIIHSVHVDFLCIH